MPTKKRTYAVGTMIGGHGVRRIKVACPPRPKTYIEAFHQLGCQVFIISQSEFVLKLPKGRTLLTTLHKYEFLSYVEISRNSTYYVYGDVTREI